MNVRRRAQVLVLGVMVGAAITLTLNVAARAQTTTNPTTATTQAATSTTKAATSTSRPSSTTSTTRRPPNRLTFTASPTVAAPGSNVTVSSVNPCTHTGNLYVLLSLGQFRLGSGAPDSTGHWRFTVVVPQVNPGTYGLSAACLVARNGVDENAGMYVGPEFTVKAGSGPAPPTTPEVHKSNSGTTALLIGLIVAVVVAIAAIAYAISLRRKHRTEAAAAGAGP